MILFVDDEDIRMESYREELEFASYKVQYESSVDSAIVFFKENLEDIELIILDVMMPPGEAFANQKTHHGLRTGAYLYEYIRKVRSNIPVIFLTNVSDEALINKVEQASGEALIKFFEKKELLPFELVDKVKDFLES